MNMFIESLTLGQDNQNIEELIPVEEEAEEAAIRFQTFLVNNHVK